MSELASELQQHPMAPEALELLANLAAAGVDDAAVLCTSHDPPLDQHEVALVATDDICLLHTDRDCGLRRLRP